MPPASSACVPCQAFTSSMRSTTASQASGAITASDTAVVISSEAMMRFPRQARSSRTYAGQLTKARMAAHTNGTMKGASTRKPSSTSPARSAAVMSRRSHGAETKSSMMTGLRLS